MKAHDDECRGRVASEMERDDDLAAGGRLKRHRERVPARSGTGTRIGRERRHGAPPASPPTAASETEAQGPPRKKRVTFSEDEHVKVTGLDWLVKRSPVFLEP